MVRGAWQAAVLGVAKELGTTEHLSTHTHTHTHTHLGLSKGKDTLGCSEI